MGAAMRHQPQGRLRLNTAHPLAQGLVGFWLPNGGGFVSALPGIPNATMASAGALGYGPKGRRLRSTSTAMAASIPHDPRYKPTGAMTVLMDGDMPTSASNFFGTENSNDGWGCYNSAIADPMIMYLRVGATWVSAGSINASQSGQAGFSYDGATFYSLVNGKRLNSQAISGTITQSTLGIGLNAKNSNGSPAANGSFYYFAIWNRALSPTELASFYANPWQIFDAGPSIAYLAAIASVSAPAGGATAANVNPGAGAITLTGYAPTVDRGAAIGVSPAAAALSITGYAPSVAQPHAAAPGAALASFTGYAPAVTQGLTQNMALSAASMAITGYAPAVAQSALRTAAPGTGAVAITGYAPTVTRGASLAVQAGATALALTGYAPTVAQQIPVIKFTVRFDVLPRNFNLKTIHFSN